MNVSAITGNSGIYSTSAVSNPSVRYGRNAANNMEQHFVHPVETPVYEANPELGDEIFAAALEKFAAALEGDEYTPAKFRYQYSNVNEGEFDKLSMLAASYEEMNNQKQMPVKKMSKLLQSAYPKEKLSAKPLDVNKNGKIETDEYSAFLALCDIKSKDKNSTNVSIMDGAITNEGLKEALSYLAVNVINPITRFKLTKNSNKTFSNIKNNLNLDDTKKEFKAKNIDFLA